MYFEDTEISKSINYRKIILDFCTYYITNKYVIVEINNDVHFDTKEIETLIASVTNNFPELSKLVYISNRVNCYSFNPLNWKIFGELDSILVAAAVINYRKTTKETSILEKQLAHIKIKRASTLEEAIGWSLQLKEFQN